MARRSKIAKMIVIVNYGMGNLGSILNMLKKVGAVAIISSDAEEIKRAKKLILPGVGNFDNGMKNISELGLLSILNDKVLVEKVPVLGICLGFQLLTKGSEEGTLPGLSWIDAQTVKFRFNKENSSLKVPHMGWNNTSIYKQSLLYNDMYEDPRFYFVHSYYVKCNNEKDILTTTSYGFDFTSSILNENIMGTQFHPEKSHKYGMKLLKNFAELI